MLLSKGDKPLERAIGARPPLQFLPQSSPLDTHCADIDVTLVTKGCFRPPGELLFLVVLSPSVCLSVFVAGEHDHDSALGFGAPILKPDKLKISRPSTGIATARGAGKRHELKP